MLAQLGYDVGHALRGLLRDRAFTLVALLSIGLGAGANSAIFSLVDQADRSRLFSRFGLLLDQFKGLPVESSAVPSEDFSFTLLFCQAFESAHELLGCLADDVRPAPKWSIRICLQAIDSLQGLFINSNCNSFHIKILADMCNVGFTF
jgi:hypothetical protein